MARMSIDDMFLRDPRVVKLARSLTWSKYEARGRLLDAFALVYDRVDAGADELVTEADIDLAADHSGLAARMIEFGLAVRVRSKVRISGATERTKYLATREESGRRGGVKSGETRRKKAEAKSKVTFDKNEGRSNPTQSYSDPPDPNHNPTHTQNASARESGASAEKPERTPEENARSVLDKLGSYNDVAYAGDPRHVELIVSQLRSGVTVDELRMVIGYCALELGWQARAEMRHCLRPETLFDPAKISKYLEPARSWFRKLEQAERRSA